MKNLAMRSDVEAGGFLFVKRAERHKIGAGPFEGQISADDVHDVAGGADLFEGGRRDQTSHARKPMGAGYFADFITSSSCSRALDLARPFCSGGVGLISNKLKSSFTALP